MNVGLDVTHWAHIISEIIIIIFSLYLQKLVAKHGLTVVSENVKGCYCGRDSCNIGCDCIDKSAAGKALYTYGVLILAVLAEVITLFY